MSKDVHYIFLERSQNVWFLEWWPSSKDYEEDGYPPKQLKDRHLRKHHHRYRPSTCLDKRHKNLELRKRRKKNKASRIARRKNR